MYMDCVIVKGGYGEHGRSCFLTPFKENRFYMLDCGIMDTDENPWPDVEPDLLKKTDYLFLSHCHKDHSGAFSQMVSRGFNGWLITTKATAALAGIRYNKVIEADPLISEPVGLGKDLRFSCGRSGHCAGGVWFHIWDSRKSCLYSGDYQPRALAYAADAVRGRRADLAIVDCAHPEAEGHADDLRADLLASIRRGLKQHGRVVLPLPKYGRGLELIVLLRRMLPQARIAADEGFTALAEQMCGYGQWLRPRALDEICGFLEEHPQERLEQDQYDILLLGDTHLEQERCRSLAKREADRGGLVIVTGRVKPGGCVRELLDGQKAVRASYPHHQSMGDFKELLEENDFQTVLPFHSGRREVYFRTGGR